MNGFQALVTFFFVLVTANGDLLKKYASESGNVYHGRYTRDVNQPELLIPRRVLEDGSFATYRLPNFYDRQEINERRKRSSEAGEREPEADKLHLVLAFNGIDHHVELSPYHEFISPDMVIETRGSGFRSNLNEAVRFKRASDRQCHYRGFVRDHHASKAALSLCDGVVGYVQTNHGRYFIEPVNEADPEPDGQHVHIAYKRSAPHENDAKHDDPPKRHCGTSDNWEAAWAEQLAKRQKRLMEDNSVASKRESAPVTSGTHSIHRYIEIGLVADRRFLDFHNNTNYEQYLLTIMNMVSDFYHDSSSGNQIDVVVVRMIYLEKEKEEIDLLISPAAEETLDSFAKWSYKMNPPDFTHPNHFDIGVLVTRYDICSEGTNCDLMGLAYVGTACNPEKAAAINEDNGLLLGIVIAHEVGHVMGCSHDEESISGCPPQDKDSSYFVMSPIVFIFTIRWSRCSRKFITALLESGLGECLNDDPKNPPEKFKYPNMLPGAMYGADFQCDMMFPGSVMCQNSPSCDVLWCKANSTCVSRGVPMADGTKCGENKWCVHKECVDMGSRPKAVHGGWGSWGPMSSCSRTCGGGVKYAERECDHPVPSNGGRYCIGARKKILTCNTQACDPTKPSFRAVQCALWNTQPVLTDGLHQWSVYSSPGLDPCQLYCINEKHTYTKLSAIVNDSTPCKPGTNNMCVSGTCRIVGCDWLLDSSAIEDKCGICKGDGSKCKKIEGLFDTKDVKERFVKIVTIPKGARSIHVSENKPHQNSLAVRLEKEKKYCLNGERMEAQSGDYECAKALIIYMHPEPEREQIEIKGPIAEDIRIEYVFYQKSENPGVRYAYYVMSTDPSYTPKYIWDFMEWSECNAKCGGGTMISEPSCVEEHGGKVSVSFCQGIQPPEPKSRTCNSEQCPAKWRVSQWSKCSACDGKTGLRHRKVQCVRPAARAGEDDVQANLDACKGRVPKQKEECVGKRPCRKSCPKKARNANGEVEAVKEKQAVDQAKMIDAFVDPMLVHGVPREADKLRRTNDADAADFRQLLRDWSVAREEKKKRSTCASERNFTTPKPGSIIKDSVPIENVVLLEAPYMEENLQSNLSDKAYQEAGDLVGMSIDTSREKVYRGSQAIQKIEELSYPNGTPSPRVVNQSSAYDRLAGIVDAVEQ
ncbi:A disintegrin and metalloproteinase with thrombospondin motifs 7-like [Hylaeus volcanicus]|uniref:A disintegrin and metalloproteinase with thrombospondin motifs 7-like n=1 Tax=Hylaeus volcanicus TaxID=313075 RepID=UPI0023B7DF57|nr:A disintegrin and metalloproteinase with thrombospondin motifs 7-like [Hylaeus volcanicus]